MTSLLGLARQATLLFAAAILIIYACRWWNKRARQARKAAGARPRVLVAVLGDVGRSPRMQYHAKSLMENGFDVDILGYTGTPLIGPLLNAEANGRLSQHLVSPPRKLDSTRGGRLVYLLSGAVRVASQLLQLAYVMLYEVPSPEAILTQTPPAIPTLVLVGLAARLRASRLVVDWHNFGYSLMALHLGPNSPIVRIAEAYELIVGQWAASGANLAVTEAMSAFLRKNMGCTAPVITFHDRPPALFSRLNAEARTQFLGRLELPLPLNKGTSGKAANQLLADHSNPSRPVLLVSSTSWTADEDFGLLLEALKEYEDRAPSSAAKLEVIVTGRGPMKSMYERQMAELTMKRVNIRTAWLEPEDYPLLLGVADLGISLHTSSSGVDLPMKAVDMFGAGLPVAALRYPVMEAEMVREGEEGLLFDREGSATLANRLIELFGSYPGTDKLERLRRNILAQFSPGESNRWEASWNKIVLPLFQQKE